MASAIHNRKSIRLSGYDYTQMGAYFITICTEDRCPLFGKINNGQMLLNPFGQIAQQCWFEIPNHFPHADVGEFVVMPDHIHGVIFITDDSGIGSRVGAKNFSPLQRPTGTSKTIGSIVRGFKIGVTKQINAIYQTPGAKIWQRNYWERVIRDEQELARIEKYIRENPMQEHLNRMP